jgi:diguanylate cyclase (GGDEF)-like protein
MPITHNTNSHQKILLIGDINKAFLDADAVKEPLFQVCSNILDAIDTAAKNSFTIIAVVMTEASGKLDSALKALRNATSGTKIILLAQMYEEPAAMQLVNSASNGEKTADDYLICPIYTSNLYKSTISAANYKTTGSIATAETERIMAEKIKQLEELAITDELTGLKNRRYICEFARQIIERAKKEDGRVTLLLFDIDDFKHYNDVYGHSAGDEILKQAAISMRHCCRPHDVVGRVGGDEFVVIFWDDPKIKRTGPTEERRSATAEHPKEPIFIAKRFRRDLEKTEFASLGAEGKGVLTISGGLASFPRDGSTVQELLLQADKALLDAKHSGKNRIYLVGKPQNDIDNI